MLNPTSSTLPLGRADASVVAANASPPRADSPNTRELSRHTHPSDRGAPGADGWRRGSAGEVRALRAIGAERPVRAVMSSPQDVPGRSHKLTLLHTNDTHGHFWRNKHGEYGFAAQKTLVDRIRGEVAADGGHVLLLSAGDINTGQPRSDILEAEPDFRAMNLLGYDAMAIGNHEFDRPNAVLRRQQKIARFPFLSANIYDAQTGARAFPAAKRFDFDGLAVHVFGLTTEETPVESNPLNTRAFRFRPAIEEAREWVASLGDRSGLLIALSHIGYERDGARPQRTLGDAALAESVPGIDVIVGGHTHLELSEPRLHGGALVLQAGAYGKCLGRLDLEIQDGQIRSHRYALLPINKKVERRGVDGAPVIDAHGAPILDPVGEIIPEDPEMIALLTPFYEASGHALERVVTESDTRFFGRSPRVQGETNLGRLVASAMRVATGADVALMNHGGLRADLEPGEVTYEEVQTVMPFGNRLVTFELTGPELARYLEVIADQIVHASGVEVTERGPEVVGLRIGGEDVAVSGGSTRRYRIVTNDFCARGGDRWPSQVENPTFVDTGIVDLEAMLRFIESRGGLRGAEFETPSFRELPAERRAA